MTRIGTSYFVSFNSAVAYYREYMDFRQVVQAVRNKQTAGEIHIGKPEIKEGERLVLLDAGTRYGIESKD